MLIALNKPYGVLCQFTSDEGRPTLADFVDVPRVYPAGRLDHDSEGLVLLTDEGALQHAIAEPSAMVSKRYWAQVEGRVDEAALGRLREGVVIGEGKDRYEARALDAHVIEAPPLPDRDPPIRKRAAIPTSWLALRITEGRNRQVRRMTAAAGFPTLRLVRVAIGKLDLVQLALEPGRWCEVDAKDVGLANPRPVAKRYERGAARAPAGSTVAHRRR